MDAAVIKKTQDTLGKVIKKPPLTEKLLTKPPFRFLHDVVTEVMKNTGAFKGLYTGDELSSSKVTEKEAKINFLQKVIDCVSFALDDPISCRPSKIVAGHEPEKTNEFLQAMGTMCLKKIDTSEAVKKVIAGEKPSARKKSSAVKDEKGDVTNEKPASGRSRDKKKESGEKEGREGSSKDREKKDKEKRDRHKDRSKERGQDKEEPDKDAKKEKRKEKDGKDEDRERRRSKAKEADEGVDRKRDKRQERKGEDEAIPEKDQKKDRHKEERKKDRGKEDREGSSKDKKSRSERGKATSENDDLIKNAIDQNESGDKKEGSRGKEKREREKEKDKERGKVDEIKDDQNEIKDDIEIDNQEINQTAKNIQRPSSAKGQRRRPSGQNDDDQDSPQHESLENEDMITNFNTSFSIATTDIRQTSATKKPVRPSSARPAPPKVKKQEIVENNEQRISSGKQMAPVIADNDKFDDEEDEDDTFIVESDSLINATLDASAGDSNTDLMSTKEHGLLVRKMLESKREADTIQNNKNKKEIEKPTFVDAAKKKEKDIAEKEIEKLRSSIQNLVRSAHPLGKIMDYLQEDIDSMQKELNVWQKENEQHANALKAEQSITECEVEPLQSHLVELELEITDMMDKISASKSNILRNEEKMYDLIEGLAS